MAGERADILVDVKGYQWGIKEECKPLPAEEEEGGQDSVGDHFRKDELSKEQGKRESEVSTEIHFGMELARSE